MEKIEVPSGLTQAERETIINFCEGDPMVNVWSASAPVVRRLRRLGLQPMRESRSQQTGKLTGCEFELPVAQFRWGLKRRARRLTAEQRAARTARLRAANPRNTGIRSSKQPQPEPKAAARQGQ